VTPAERRERQLADIRNAGIARAKAEPPLTDRQIERLAFLINPHVAAPRHNAPAALLKAA
jgi:hypothetical protein